MYEYECYQKEQLIKELLLLENHLVTFKCMHCIKKHKYTCWALAEETIKITPRDSEKRLLTDIAKATAGPQTNLQLIRKLRIDLMSITPKSCLHEIKKKSLCSGKSCSHNSYHY